MKQQYNDEIDLKILVKTLLENKYIILFFILFSLVVASVYALSSSQKWVSESFITRPHFGQLANYPEALKLSNNNLDINNLTNKVFTNFINKINAHIANEKPLSNVNLVKLKDADYYVISLSAENAEIAQHQLQKLLGTLNQQVQANLYLSTELAMQNQEENLQLRIQSQKISAQEKKQQHLALLDYALKVAQDNKQQINEIGSLPNHIPEDALFLMGVPAIQSLITQEEARPLIFDNSYYLNVEDIARINNFKFNSMNFYSFDLILPPTLPVDKSSPKLALIMLLALVLGFIMGSVYIMFSQLFSDDVRTKD